MEFYLSKTIKNTTFSDTEAAVIEKLKEHGFGVITEIDVQTTLKNKIGAAFVPYKILGACNPHFAFEALSKNDKIGVMLPCNVCLREVDETTVDVFAINPLVAMQSINEKGTGELAHHVYESLLAMLNSLES